MDCSLCCILDPISYCCEANWVAISSTTFPATFVARCHKVQSCNRNGLKATSFLCSIVKFVPNKNKQMNDGMLPFETNPTNGARAERRKASHSLPVLGPIRSFKCCVFKLSELLVEPGNDLIAQIIISSDTRNTLN